METVWPLVMDTLFRIRSEVAVPTLPSTTAVAPDVTIRNHDAVPVLPAVAEPMALAVKTLGWAEVDAGAKGVPHVWLDKRT